MPVINLTLDLHSYCADPYRPERARLITIQTQSGMNRARSSANRRRALEDWLGAEGMTLAEYDELVRRAEEPWDLDDTKHIIIPRRNVAAMLVEMCDTARAAMRPCPASAARTVLRPGVWTTTATPDDALVWERLVVVTAGTGAKLSNQKGERRNWYIGAQPPDPACEPTAPVLVTGTIEINEEMVRPEVLLKALEWAGEWVGIGASRGMGWGRWRVVDFEL